VKWALDITYDLAQLGKTKPPTTPKDKPVWKKPREGTIKINVDAGFIEMDRQGTTGLVVRDHRGQLLLGQALWYEHAANSLIMEALAVRDGVQLAIDRNLSSVEIETDARVVLNQLEDPGGSRSEITSICQEIKELSGFISSINFKFIGRLANEAAHLCAKSASSNRRRCLWINYKPLFLENVLLKDCNPIT
jgi:ribonuclease HI